jgi:hypothetical protein
MVNKVAETPTKSSKNDREMASWKTGFSNFLKPPLFVTQVFPQPKKVAETERRNRSSPHLYYRLRTLLRKVPQRQEKYTNEYFAGCWKHELYPQVFLVKNN